MERLNPVTTETLFATRMTRVTWVNTGYYKILHTDFYLMGGEGSMFVIWLHVLLFISIHNKSLNYCNDYSSRSVCVWLFTLTLLALTFVAPQRCVCESAERGWSVWGTSPGVSWPRMNELNEHVRGLKSQVMVAKCEPRRLAHNAVWGSARTFRSAWVTKLKERCLNSCVCVET